MASPHLEALVHLHSLRHPYLRRPNVRERRRSVPVQRRQRRHVVEIDQPDVAYPATPSGCSSSSGNSEPDMRARAYDAATLRKARDSAESVLDEARTRGVYNTVISKCSIERRKPMTGKREQRGRGAREIEEREGNGRGREECGEDRGIKGYKRDNAPRSFRDVLDYASPFPPNCRSPPTEYHCPPSGVRREWHPQRGNRRSYIIKERRRAIGRRDRGGTAYARKV
ncbi:hypothetical protein B0H12DRAFT_1073311 [Mycena haematopus]|nr:hypothetical protein B0H12DRAFT_1073311 [Mycena haematopus]